MVFKTEEKILDETRDGNIKYASKRVTVGSGDTHEFLIQAPDATDLKADIIGMEFTGGAQASIDILEDATVDTAGSDMLITNAKTGSSASTNLNLEHNGTYSGGTLSAELLLPGGTQNTAQSGSAGDPIRTIVSNGDNLLVQLTNNAGSGDNEFGIELIFADVEV